MDTNVHEWEGKCRGMDGVYHGAHGGTEREGRDENENADEWGKFPIIPGIPRVRGLKFHEATCGKHRPPGLVPRDSATPIRVPEARITAHILVNPMVPRASHPNTEQAAPSRRTPIQGPHYPRHTNPPEAESRGTTDDGHGVSGWPRHGPIMLLAAPGQREGTSKTFRCLRQ